MRPAQPHSGESTRRLRLVARGFAAPLAHRLRRGEGGLLLVNASLAWKEYPRRGAISLAAISTLTLLALYLFNDIIDAPQDQQNPKKDRELADMYVGARGVFLTGWLLLSTVALVAATWLDARAGLGVGAVALINVAYSLFCKKVPMLDLVWVSLWGAAYASIVTGTVVWIVMVGTMTAVCHIYQASEDRDADATNGVATSATLTAPLLSTVQAALAAVLMAAAWMLGAAVVALTFAGFFAYWRIWCDRPRIGWFLTKAHFSVAWAYLLVRG